MDDCNEPLKKLEYIFHYWWVIVLISILGGLIGWIISITRPVIYESTAEITSSVDFTRTGTLTDIEQDQIIVPVGDVISSSDVAEKVIAKTKTEGYILETAEFRKISFLERKNQTWVMRIRNQDKGLTIRLVDIWVETAIDSLNIGSIHAIMAEQYKRYLDSLSGCIQKMTSIEPVYGNCETANLNNIQSEINKTGLLIEKENEISLGLSPALKISKNKGSDNSSKSVLNGVNTMILSCGMLGFVLGILILQTKFLKGFLENIIRA